MHRTKGSERAGDLSCERGIVNLRGGRPATKRLLTPRLTPNAYVLTSITSDGAAGVWGTVALRWSWQCSIKLNRCCSKDSFVGCIRGDVFWRPQIHMLLVGPFGGVLVLASKNHFVVVGFAVHACKGPLSLSSVSSSLSLGALSVLPVRVHRSSLLSLPGVCFRWTPHI